MAPNKAALPSTTSTPAPLANNYGGSSPAIAAAPQRPAGGVLASTSPYGAPTAAGGAAPIGYNAPSTPASGEPYGAATMGYGANQAGATAATNRASLPPQSGYYNPTYPSATAATGAAPTASPYGAAGGATAPAYSTAAAPSTAYPAARYPSSTPAASPYATTASPYGGAPTASAPTWNGASPANTSGGYTASTASVAPANTSGGMTASTASRSTNGQVVPAGGALPAPGPAPYQPVNNATAAGGYRPGSTSTYPGLTTSAVSAAPTTSTPTASRYPGIPATPSAGQAGPATVYPSTSYPSTGR